MSHVLEISGALLLFLILDFGFSGYLLPWNQLAFFATIVATDVGGKDCSICHEVIGQKEAGTVMIAAPEAQFQHPVDLGDLRELTCAECHTGSSM